MDYKLPIKSARSIFKRKEASTHDQRIFPLSFGMDSFHSRFDGDQGQRRYSLGFKGLAKHLAMKGYQKEEIKKEVVSWLKLILLHLEPTFYDKLSLIASRRNKGISQ